MGRVATFDAVEMQPVSAGVTRGAITQGDLTEFAADLVRVAPGRMWQHTAAAGTDSYVFALSGAGTISAGATTLAMPPQTFATLSEGTSARVTATGAEPLELVLVVTPLTRREGLPGFSEGLAVAERARCPVVPIPADHKQRIYFCGHHGGAYTERGHGMIVVYDGQTHTVLHHHPDAESLFILLDGACEFTVEGHQVVVQPGQATYFRMNDSHGLKTAAGHAGASFLEFHIPAKFSTVKA